MDHKSFIQSMTLKEKAEATVMRNGRCFVTERLGNTGFVVKDNPRGDIDYAVEDPKQRKPGDYYPVAWPQAAAAAAAWSEDVSYEIGKAMGRECKKRGINVLLRPGVNIKRSPLCGRNFEYYSEDPVLAGKLGGAFIRGTQSEGTAACLKHYAVNSQEFERMTTNAVVSTRALRELYLKAFEIAVREGQPWTVMSSYNKVNGQWVPANETLMKNLREDFGFEGAVISDAMAIHTEKVRSHQCGLDFEIASGSLHPRELMDAVEQGLLDEKVLDTSIDRLLTLEDQTDALSIPDESVWANGADERAGADHARARVLAASGIVLLKNDGSLPLAGGQQIAVIGKLAKTPNYMGCGSGHMNGWSIDSTFEELEKLAKAKLLYADGYALADRPWREHEPDPELIDEAVAAARQADIVLFFTGLPIGYESEGYDRKNLELPKDMTAALAAVLDTGKPVVVINVSGAPVDLGLAKDRAAAIIHSYLAGEAMGGAIADVLFGAAEPGGRLPETFPVRLEDTPSYLSFPAWPTVMPDVIYGEDIFVGYRWYEKRRIPVQFPFGYGLSYTTFEYSGITLENAGAAADSSATPGADSAAQVGGASVSGASDCASCGVAPGVTAAVADTVRVRVTVKNTGERRGSQVLQLYAGKPESSFVRPEKELKAFARIELAAGEEKTVTLEVPCCELGVYDEKHDRWVREAGLWELTLGTSSADTVARLPFTLKSGEAAQIYHKLLPAEWFNKYPNIDHILKNHSEAARDFLGSQPSAMGDLISALPVYRKTEDSAFGGASISASEITDILGEINEEGKKL